MTTVRRSGRGADAVPRLRRRYVDEVEASAARLLHRFAADFGPITAPPVPFELIADFLELAIQPTPLHDIAPDVLGAIDFGARTIWVDTGCVRSARYGFTVCHELG